MALLLFLACSQALLHVISVNFGKYEHMTTVPVGGIRGRPHRLDYVCIVSCAVYSERVS